MDLEGQIGPQTSAIAINLPKSKEKNEKPTINRIMVVIRPTRTISCLPSNSGAALTEVLHAAPGRGCEHRYSDHAQNQFRGDAWLTHSH